MYMYVHMYMYEPTCLSLQELIADYVKSAGKVWFLQVKAFRLIPPVSKSARANNAKSGYAA